MRGAVFFDNDLGPVPHGGRAETHSQSQRMALVGAARTATGLLRRAVI
jgi:hypothetical protein